MLFYQSIMRGFFARAYAAAVRRAVLPRLSVFAKGDTRTDSADDEIDSLNREMEDAISGLTENRAFLQQLDKVGKRVGQHGKNEFVRLGLGKLRDTEPRIGAMITEWRAVNLDLITSLAEHQVGMLETILRAAEGLSTDSLKDRILEHIDVTESKAEFLARDQVLKLNADMVQERQTSAGITSYIWTTVGDERVREMHDDLEGTEQQWDDPPVTNKDGDQNHPGQDYQCRCTAFPILPELGDDTAPAEQDQEEPQDESA